jgi:alpha-amylase/alpha-mannosidase (GH57 family)
MPNIPSLGENSNESRNTDFIAMNIITRSFLLVTLLAVVVAARTAAQPSMINNLVRFTYRGTDASSVSLVGDFNGWTVGEDPMHRDSSGAWSATRRLSPGLFQYKFVIDGERYILDPGNPVAIENYNKSSRNSIFALTGENTIVLTDTPLRQEPNTADEYPAMNGRKPVYLNIVWHQHQPLYVDPAKDQLQGPWVRVHSTKSYYDMTAMLLAYPKVHVNVNLTTSLLLQLREYYIRRLGPYIDTHAGSMDVNGFQKKWKGKTDPWIDLLLKPTSEFTHQDKDYLYRNDWNCFSISEVMIARFPEYEALQEKLIASIDRSDSLFTEQEMRETKFWFALALFDPDFLFGPVSLPDGSVCDLSDYLERRGDDRFFLRKRVTEEDCRRMVVEAYKVMSSIIPIHREMRYDPGTRTGQVEVITTPFYHPILPLIYDSDLAATGQPGEPLPPRFHYPEDARAQVLKAVVFYSDLFGFPPLGMWPAEGSVAQPVLPIFRENGILWVASDVKVLKKSRPGGMENTVPFSFPAGDSLISLVFRDTELSDRIGFTYQNYRGEEAAEDFVRSIRSYAPREDGDDVLITVILDGENAWEWYRYDYDGKNFLHALYRKLSRLYDLDQVITTTTAEYILGNTGRGIRPHPAGEQTAMRWLFPGSWINGNYDTWIGEQEENRAWKYLLRTREDLERSGIPRPDPAATAPATGTPDWFNYMAWEEMYAAEGSDWFWWYGTDQTVTAEKEFDDAFRIHLENVYSFGGRAGMHSPGFPPIMDSTIHNASSATSSAGGVMAESNKRTTVTFSVDARDRNVPAALYISGNIPELGDWTPNFVRMYDDGTHGDLVAWDGIWSLAIEVKPGSELLYKYSNSGVRGTWEGEEFPGRNRSLMVPENPPSDITQNDTFGRY